MIVKSNMNNRKRNVRVHFYLTKEENNILNKKIKATKFNNRSSYIREMILNGLIIVNDYSELQNLITEINKIGVNINQITRLSNTNQNIYKDDIKKLQEKLEKIYIKVSEFE